MTAPITAGRTGGVSFRLLGVPVTIHVTFLVIIGLFGIGLGDPIRVGAWILVAAVSVLLHEMGHALVGRAYGLHPKVDLAGMGGLTSWEGEATPGGRLQSLAISAAGPGIGIVAGLLAVAGGANCCNPVGAPTLTEFVTTTWVYVSFAWGIFNLLPILPLDGGHIAESLMPGNTLTRRLRASYLSIGTAAGAAVAAVYTGLAFGAILLGLFAWTNIRTVAAIRQQSSASARLQREAAQMARAGNVAGALDLAEQAARSEGPASVRAAAASLVVHLLVDNDRPDDALALAIDPRPGLSLSESSIGRALAATDGTPAAAAHLVALRETEPDTRARGIEAMRAAFLGDFDVAEQLLHGGPVGPGIAETIRALRPG